MMAALSGETQPTRMLVCQGWRTLSFCGDNTRKHASRKELQNRGIEEAQPNRTHHIDRNHHDQQHIRHTDQAAASYPAMVEPVRSTS
jgi:hypothetical protein